MRLIALILSISLLTGSLKAQWKEVQFDDSDMALDLAEAKTYQKYPTYPQYVEMMQNFAADFPHICKLDTFGTSTQGRLLLALKISDHPLEEEAEANFLYTSTIHGDELLGFNLLLRLADTLLQGYGSDSEITGLVDSLAIWINPLANPDGSYMNDNNLSLKQAMRDNANGIDLNRSFPDPSKGEPDDTTGREPENKAMMDFLWKHGIIMSANLHSGEEVVNYPWDYTFDLHADDPWYRFISREYADEARAIDPTYMELFTDGITNGAEWYVIKGGRQDYVNYYLGGREVTLELSKTFLLGSELLEEHWILNRRSLLNYMSQCTYGIRGKVTDKESGEPLRARIHIPYHDSSYSVVHSFADFGDYYRLIKEGVYDLVFSAPGYLNDTITGVNFTDYQATYLDVALERDPSAGLLSPRNVPNFSIFPNPVSQQLFIESIFVPYGPVEISIHGLDGLTYLQTSLYNSGKVLEVRTDFLQEGFYILQINHPRLSKSFGFIKQ